MTKVSIANFYHKIFFDVIHNFMVDAILEKLIDVLNRFPNSGKKVLELVKLKHKSKVEKK